MKPTEQEIEKYIKEQPILLPHIDWPDIQHDFLKKEPTASMPINAHFFAAYQSGGRGSYDMRSTSFNGSYTILSDMAFASGIVYYKYGPTRLNPNRDGPFYVEYNDKTGLLLIQFAGREWEVNAKNNPQRVHVNFNAQAGVFSFVLRDSIAMIKSPRTKLIKGSMIQVP